MKLKKRDQKGFTDTLIFPLAEAVVDAGADSLLPERAQRESSNESYTQKLGMT